MDETGLGVQLVKRLEQAQQELFTVQAGEQFERLSETVFAINPQRPFVISAHKVSYGLSVMFWTASALILVALAVTA